MGKLISIGSISVAVVVVFLAFAPIGAALGELAERSYTSMVDGAAATAIEVLTPLLVADAVGLLLALGISLAGGVALPSGLPHVFFALFLPLTMGAMQLRYFELIGNADGLADAFGGYNFVAMFLASVLVVQLGVHLSRRRFEATDA